MNPSHTFSSFSMLACTLYTTCAWFPLYTSNFTDKKKYFKGLYFVIPWGKSRYNGEKSTENVFPPKIVAYHKYCEVRIYKKSQVPLLQTRKKLLVVEIELVYLIKVLFMTLLKW